MRAKLIACLLSLFAIGLSPGTQAQGGSARVFDFYILALSWSPGFCALEGDRGGGQCDPLGRFGFVVHGLWPQGGGGPLNDCEAGQRPPSRANLDEVQDLFPSDGLARHEWSKHGGCSGLPPAAWFADVRRARDGVKIPASLESLRQEKQIEPEEVLRAFREANPRLRPGMAAIACPRNIFQEIRLCLSKDTRDFVPCPEVVRQSCRARSISLRPRI